MVAWTGRGVGLCLLEINVALPHPPSQHTCVVPQSVAVSLGTNRPFPNVSSSLFDRESVPAEVALAA